MMAMTAAAVTRCAAVATARTRAPYLLSMPTLNMNSAHVALAGIYTLVLAADEGHAACGSVPGVRAVCAAPSAAPGAAGRPDCVRRLRSVFAPCRGRQTGVMGHLRRTPGGSGRAMGAPAVAHGHVGGCGCGTVASAVAFRSVARSRGPLSTGLVVVDGRDIVFMSVSASICKLYIMLSVVSAAKRAKDLRTSAPRT
jgi:hypothetical protein